MHFGIRQGGGRRPAKREATPLPALLTTLGRTYSVEAVDLSITGARLRGDDLPEIGTELELKLESLNAFAVVCWRKDTECGLEFDLPLSGPEIAALCNDVARSAWMPADVRQAFDHWKNGFAR
ncbi:PilZ domain-containing protein [Sphingomonas ginkgonis]|uniref:PilZ domain-containing protein n=1 Tax=Sphingomonas ginkgonis TaxID=2315330 RepID=A0A3R9YN69_9SPHN|nr:PilZ domain-containing protein [Sphingomonas ginkgonis]